MKKIIVTGASGFLGKSFVRKALGDGTEVYAVVKDITKLKDIENHHLLHVLQLDLEQISTLPQLIKMEGFDAFYHFAWAGTSGIGREDYGLQIKNIKMACKAVDAACKMKCEKFINAGSLMEYESMKFMERPGEIPAGNYIYRSAKLAARYLAKAEAGRAGIPFVNLIISNIYGKGEVSGRLISATLQKIMKGEKATFTAGTQLYDFIYITDALEAFYLVGQYGKPYTDYYIGSNQIKPLREYIQEIFACLPTEETPVFGEILYDGGSLGFDEFERDNLKRDTGFCCRTSFQEGIKETFEWLREREGGI